MIIIIKNVKIIMSIMKMKNKKIMSKCIIMNNEW